MGGRRMIEISAGYLAVAEVRPEGHILGALLGLGILITGFYLLWRYLEGLPKTIRGEAGEFGSDIDLGKIDHSPGGGRFFLFYSYDLRCWLADMVGLWDRGLISIEQEKDGMASGWVFRSKVEKPSMALTPGEELLWREYFSEGGEWRTSLSELSQDFSFWDRIQAHEKCLRKIYLPTYYQVLGWQLAFCLSGSILAGVVALALARGELFYLLLPLWFGMLYLPYRYREKFRRDSEAGIFFYRQMAGVKLNMPILSEEMGETPPENGFPMGWAVALEEERGWVFKLGVQADYAWNLRILRTRETAVGFEGQKSYAYDQVGKRLENRWGPVWARRNPKP